MAEEEKTVQGDKSFWEHLEDLRWVIFRSLIAIVLCAVVVFINKDLLTSIIFAPEKSDFVIYRGMCRLSDIVGIGALCPSDFSVELLNTKLASPFFTHMTSSLYAGLLLAFPFVIYQIWRFVAPALYPNEKKQSAWVLVACVFLFACGILLAYFLVFPLAFRFLGTYNFGDEVVNRIDLHSYMSTFYTTIFAVGLVFEMPILAYFLARLGVVTSKMLTAYRKHAIVAILIIAAFITPTQDPFTLLLVGGPMYLLYEISIVVAKKAAAKRALEIEEREANAD
jgi:sec-independent protein translocase protein TatC